TAHSPGTATENAQTREGPLIVARQFTGTGFRQSCETWFPSGPPGPLSRFRRGKNDPRYVLGWAPAGRSGLYPARYSFCRVNAGLLPVIPNPTSPSKRNSGLQNFGRLVAGLRERFGSRRLESRFSPRPREGGTAPFHFRLQHEKKGVEGFHARTSRVG